MVALAACSIETSGLAGIDGSVRDAGDAFVPPTDAGPLCARFGAPRVARVLDGDDFASAESTRADVVVAPSGNLELRLAPWRHEALLFAAYDATLLDPGAPGFEMFAGATPVGWAFSGDLDQSYSGDLTPPGLEREYVSWTVLATGEIWLEAGVHTLTLDADDRAVAEVTVGTATYVAAVTAVAAEDSVTIEIGADGWYPLRIGWLDYADDAFLQLLLTPPSGSSEIVSPSRLRTDASAIEGRELWGWDEIVPDDTPDGWRIDRDPTSNDFSDPSRPQGVGITDNNTFYALWTGRAYVAQERPFLQARGDERFHLWLDGAYVGGAATGSWLWPVVAGYYDVVLALEQNGGGRAIALSRDGAPWQPAEMRAHTRFGGRTFTAFSFASNNVDAGRNHMLPLTLAAPPDPACAVEVSAAIRTTAPDQVAITVRAPDGTSIGPMTLADRARAVVGTNLHLFRAVVRPSAEGFDPDVGGDWSVHLRNDGATRAVWTTTGILAHVGCGPDPHTRHGRWTSQVIDLEREHEITRVLTPAQRPFGTSVTARIRAGRTLAALEAAVGWLTANADGTLPSPVIGRYAQLELQLSGPGYDTPRVLDARIVGAPCVDCLAAGTCEEPIHDGLQALYTFEETDLRRVREVSGAGAPLDLLIAEPDAVRRTAGTLTVVNPTRISSFEAPTRLSEALMATDAITVEALVTPRPAVQPVDGATGPSRIVTLSRDAGARSWTLGQEGDVFTVRLRTTTGSDTGGMPYLFGMHTIEPLATHVAFTYDAATGLTLYVDGNVDETLARDGTFDWNPAMLFGLANEPEDERPWTGDYHWVAIYDRALSADEIRQSYEALRP